MIGCDNVSNGVRSESNAARNVCGCQIFNPEAERVRCKAARVGDPGLLQCAPMLTAFFSQDGRQEESVRRELFREEWSCFGKVTFYPWPDRFVDLNIVGFAGCSFFVLEVAGVKTYTPCVTASVQIAEIVFLPCHGGKLAYPHWIRDKKFAKDDVSKPSVIGEDVGNGRLRGNEPINEFNESS